MRPGDGTILTPDFKGRYDGECQSTAIDREHGRVECVELSRQYLHLSPLVDVA